MEKILSVRNLKKYYFTKKSKVKAVDDVSFDGYKGDILGILGPNGSGKTTIIKSIATIIEYDKGEIEICGESNRNKKRVLNKIGAVLEGSRNIYWRLTPVENMKYFAGLRGFSFKQIKSKIDYFLESFDMEDVRNKQVRFFSNGMKQKVAIMCALIGDPEVVLLDEPTLGLDIETTYSMKKWIKNFARKENKLFLITSHDMKFIENICDRVIIIKEGKILIEDTVNNLKKFFSKKVYKITISDSLLDSQFMELKKIDNFRYEKTKEGLELYFTLQNPGKLYDIFKILSITKNDIVSLDVLNDDFDDVFLEIIKKNKIKEEYNYEEIH